MPRLAGSPHSVSHGRAEGDRLRIVVPRYGEAVVGGAEGAMRQLARALSSRGWRVDVWTTTSLDDWTWSGNYAVGAELDGDVAVRRFPTVWHRRPAFRQLSTAVYHFRGRLSPEHLWALSQGPYAPKLVSALADSGGVPTLFSPYLYHPTLYGMPAAAHPRLLCPAVHDEPALRLGVTRRALFAADGFWFHSPEERELLADVYPALRDRPWACGVVGVEAPAGLDRTAFATRHGLPGPYLYHGGRAAPGKGLDVLLEAFKVVRASHPSVSLVLSGGAGATPRVRGVHSVGHLDELERWQAMAGATAVVVPGELESLSLLALESWAVGTPCLLNGRSSVLRGHAARSGAGLTFLSSVELAEQAVYLVQHPVHSEAMGAAGRRYVESTYRWDMVEQRLRSLLESAW